MSQAASRRPLTVEATCSGQSCTGTGLSGVLRFSLSVSFRWAPQSCRSTGDDQLVATIQRHSLTPIVMNNCLTRRPWSLGLWGSGFKSLLKHGCLSSSVYYNHYHSLVTLSSTLYSLKFRVFWDVASYGLIVVDRRFRGTYCLHHQGDQWRKYAPLKHRSTPTRLL
jgi:hypothetical protein